MKQVYQIKFTKTSYELDKDYERLSEHEKVDISSMTPDSFFDFNNNDGHYTLYLIFSPLEVERYSKILQNNLIEHSISNLSDLVRLQHAGGSLPNRVFGLNHLRLAQPLGGRVSRYPKPATGLAH